MRGAPSLVQFSSPFSALEIASNYLVLLFITIIFPLYFYINCDVIKLRNPLWLWDLKIFERRREREEKRETGRNIKGEKEGKGKKRI